MQNSVGQNGRQIMNLQFVNETEQVISESLNEAGLKSDSDSDDGGPAAKRSAPDGSGGYIKGLKPGKKTKGRVKIKMEFIENKLRRYTTFSKRKTGIMKKAYELSTLTGTQVMLLVASETGHVYTFATKKLQPMITSESGKALIQTCLNSPDAMMVSPTHTASDQRMNPTGFEETELSYGISDEEREDSPTLKEDMKTGLYIQSSSPVPPSNNLPPSTNSLSPPPGTMTPQGILATLPGSQPQAATIQLQPPPAHMGIQTTTPLTQPPQAHMGSSATTTVASSMATPRTIAMTTYLTPQPAPVQSQPHAKPALSMQLPTGGFTLLQNPSLSNPSMGNTITISPLPQAQTLQPPLQQQQQIQNGQPQPAQTQQPTAVYRIQTPSGQVITLPGNMGQMMTSQPVSTATPVATTAPGAIPHQSVAAVVSGVSSSAAAPVMYQTPQGIVYATPNTMGGIPEGFIINLPQPGSVSVQGDHQPGGAQQYITIPVPVSLAQNTTQMLQPMFTQAAGNKHDKLAK